MSSKWNRTAHPVWENGGSIPPMYAKQKGIGMEYTLEELEHQLDLTLTHSSKMRYKLEDGKYLDRDILDFRILRNQLRLLKAGIQMLKEQRK